MKVVNFILLIFLLILSSIQLAVINNKVWQRKLGFDAEERDIMQFFNLIEMFLLFVAIVLNVIYKDEYKKVYWLIGFIFLLLINFYFNRVYSYNSTTN